ncbi:MAG TPA: peptide chain release factor N(5)-glutamine methyltransferase [Mollicutes bacterium]|nr:peptide chain release factor N(5)-glutamine methyltransferase [Mollicutes bacterium]
MENKISDQDLLLLKAKYRNIKPILKKIEKGYPIQYLIGNVNFCGCKINVNKHTLIPRFETEYLVEKTIKYIKKLNLNKSSVLEVGTGSGCISIILKKELKTLEITSIDISKKALKVASKNAKLNKVKINFIKKDVFKFNLINKYDILISNPPYILPKDKDKKLKYEPKKALYADNTGLNYYKQIFKIASKSLNPKFLIALEIEETMGDKIKEVSKDYFKDVVIKLEKDLAGKNRYIFIYTE